MQNNLENVPFDEKLVNALKDSEDYQEYERAFEGATGLPLSIEPASHMSLALCSKHQGRTSFCALMTQSGNSCQTCQALHRNIEKEMGIEEQDSSEKAAAAGTTFTEKSPDSVRAVAKAFGEAPRTFECFAGLCETMIPIKAGDKLVAFLKTGQVMVKKPSQETFRKAMGKLSETSDNSNIAALESAYFATPVLPPQQYRAMTNLLKSYATHLSDISQKLAFSQNAAEPESIRNAKIFIANNHQDSIGLEDAAKAAAMSPFHFSKRFKEATGIGFSEYLSQLRLDACKKLLWDPNKRITEAAFEAGFQSMASFNRIWRKHEEVPPNVYRKNLLAKQ